MHFRNAFEIPMLPVHVKTASKSIPFSFSFSCHRFVIFLSMHVLFGPKNEIVNRFQDVDALINKLDSEPPLVSFINCRRSVLLKRCLKKYCQCFVQGRYCLDICVCKDCHNHAGARQIKQEETADEAIDKTVVQSSSWNVVDTTMMEQTSEPASEPVTEPVSEPASEPVFEPTPEILSDLSSDESCDSVINNPTQFPLEIELATAEV